MFTSDTYKDLRNSIIGRKLLFSILLFSTIVTLFLTSFQVYLDYKKGIDGIYNRIDQIRISQLESLAQNVWNINNDQIRIQLRGLLEIKSIKKLKIISPDNENISISKEDQTQEPIITTMPLIYKVKGKDIDLGKLQIVSDKSHVIKELRSKILIILLTQATKTFLVSLFILFIYNILVNRHIIQIGVFARELSLENIGKKLTLDRSENEDHDELDDLADAINVMQDRFVDEMEQRKHFEKQLRQSQKMEALGTLASGIAHDFNNILQGLYNALFLIEEEVIDNAEALEKIETANGLTDRARELVKQILIFTRQEDGAFDSFLPIPAIEDVVEILKAASNNTVNISLEIDPPNGKLYGDQTQFKQVVLNIGNNAIQAVEERDKPKVTIKVTSLILESLNHLNLSPGEYLKIEVTDNGHGIKEDILERIFEPFFTTKDVGKGTGLGLSVVHGIIQRHNGEIKIKSTINESTQMSIYLPLFSNQIFNNENNYTGQEPVIFLSNDENLTGHYLLALEHMKQTPNIVHSYTDLYEMLLTIKGKDQELPIIIIDKSVIHKSKLQDKLSKLRKLSETMAILLITPTKEYPISLPEELNITQVKQSTDSKLNNYNDMALILRMRELKYAMAMAKKALSD